MKKTAIISLLLVAVFLLCSCTQQAVVLDSTIRWYEGEEMTYSVKRIADLDDYGVDQIQGSLLIPYEVDGTFTTKVGTVNKESFTTTLETTLDIWQTYAVAQLGDFDRSQIPADYVKSAPEGDTLIELRTTVYSSVEFSLYKCISVTTTTKGAIVVVGDKEKNVPNHVEFNDYTVESKSFDNQQATYTLTHNQDAFPEYPNVTDGKLSLENAGDYTDNAALAFIVRSFDLDDLKNAGSTTVNVTDFVAGNLRSASLTPNSESDAIEEALGEATAEKYFAVKVSSGTTLRGSVNWFYMDTNVEVVPGNKNLYDDGTFSASKNRIVAMQQGYLLFLLDGEFDVA